MIICLKYINALVHSCYPSIHEKIRALFMVKDLVKCCGRQRYVCGMVAERGKELFHTPVGKLFSHVGLIPLINGAIQVPSS